MNDEKAEEARYVGEVNLTPVNLAKGSCNDHLMTAEDSLGDLTRAIEQ